MPTCDNANKLPNFGQVDIDCKTLSQHEGMADLSLQPPLFPPKHQQGAQLWHHGPELLPAGAQGHVTSPSATSNTLPYCVVYQDLDSEILDQEDTDFATQSQHGGMPDYRSQPPPLPPKHWQGVPLQHLSPEPLPFAATTYIRRLQHDGHGEAGLTVLEDLRGARSCRGGRAYTAGMTDI